jgi:P27 family predicted phage terminase small subunit
MLDSRPDAVVVQHLHPDDAIDPILSNVVNTSPCACASDRLLSNIGTPQRVDLIRNGPSHLCPPAKAEWRRLAAQLTILRILTELDRAALAAYCQAYGRWVEAERKLHGTPILIKLPSGFVQQNPSLTIANKQLELIHKYLTEFGLSPVARSRVSLSALPSGKSKFDGLLGAYAQPDEHFGD